jgi:hypothetical protein
MVKKITALKIDVLRTYLSMVTGSLGTRMYRHLWCADNGQSRDILLNGQLSCGTYVSGILFQNKLLADMHSTIQGTLADMKRSGWRRIKAVRPGAVILWEAKLGAGGGMHEHLGFVLNRTTAISHRDTKLTPIKHHLTYGPRGSKQYRKIVSIWWHPKLSASK